MEDGEIEAFLQLTGAELVAIPLITLTTREICLQIFRKKILVLEENQIKSPSKNQTEENSYIFS